MFKTKTIDDKSTIDYSLHILTYTGTLGRISESI